MQRVTEVNEDLQLADESERHQQPVWPGHELPVACLQPAHRFAGLLKSAPPAARPPGRRFFPGLLHWTPHETTPCIGPVPARLRRAGTVVFLQAHRRRHRRALQSAGHRGGRGRGRQGRLRHHARRNACRQWPRAHVEVAVQDRLQFQGDDRERARAPGRPGQIALGRSGHQASAAVRDVRSVGHEEHAGARPARAQQRAARRRRRPDAVAGAEQVHARRHHRRAQVHQAGLRLSIRLCVRQPAVRRRRRSRRGRGRGAVRDARAARGLRPARA